ncbi:acyl-CoA dehydrogenase family protein [Streptomyces sp. NPDC002896]|uniref:acyl-CoA dehydrogenase family protein n=1 Tax=Streptomyces sp. NPDC002896 TaxID=3154438 RepID=UPI00332ED0A5
MSDHLEDLTVAVRDVFAGRHPVGSSPPAGSDRKLWDDLERLGFTSLTVPEELGGAGGTLRDAAVLVREAASASAAIPLAEALFLAGPLLAAAQAALPAGMLTAATGDITAETGSCGSWRLSGSLSRVPWLRSADFLLTLADTPQGPAVSLVSTDEPGLRVSPGENLAGEQRDSAILDGVEAYEIHWPADVCRQGELSLYGAAARAAQLAGAARAVLDATSRYVSERVQFGRPLVRFQAVQQQLAQLAGAVVTVEVSADAAVLALAEGTRHRELAVASAKAEASALARQITAIAHQLHGAIGFTREHRLGAHTTRLWSWREEYGNELYWQRRSADLVAEADDLWQLVSGADLKVHNRTTQGSRTGVS